MIARRPIKQTRRDATPRQIARIQRMALRVAKLRGHAKHEHILVLADMMEETGWPQNPNIVPTGRRGRPQRWGVYNLDVWGNAKDGFEINEQYPAGTIRFPTREYVYNVQWYRDNFSKCLSTPRAVTVGYTLEEDDIWKYFKQEYLMPAVKRKQITIDIPYGDIIEISSSKNGKPLFTIQRHGLPS